MPKNIKNNTLKEILDIILYEAPSTQDEIAEKLNISRRYVTKLLKPLIDENVIKKAYVVDLKKFNEISENYETENSLPEYSESQKADSCSGQCRKQRTTMLIWLKKH